MGKRYPGRILDCKPMSVDYRRLIDQGVAMPLDIWPNGAVGYSLRKLRHQYTGPAIRVRRSNDNAELDIPFLQNNYIDVNSLVSFVGANTGFVTTWYDQSGNNRHAIQTTTTRQPTIIINGVLQTKNGRPCIVFVDLDGTSNPNDQFLVMPVWYNLSEANLFAFQVFSQDAQTPSNFPTLQTGQTGGLRLQTNNNRQVATATLRTSGTTSLTSTLQYTLNAQILRVDSANRVNIFSWVNNVNFITGADLNSDFSTIMGGGINFGGTINVGNTGWLTFQEAIFYTIDQSANRLAISNNINQYYTIF